MALVPYKNTKKHTVCIGNKAVKSGETRPVEETLLPGYKSPAAKKEAPINPLVDVLNGNVKEVLAALEELSDDELDAIKTLEEASEKPRKGVLDGVLEETMKRSSAGLDSDQETGADLGNT